MSLLLLYPSSVSPIIAVYPEPEDVRQGIEYGPNGDDYIGTLVLTGDCPTTEQIVYAIVNAPEFKAIKAAVYDSIIRNGNVLTLSNGATQTFSDSGRVKAGG